MDSVTEFVEECFNFVECEKCRSTFSCTCEVHHDSDVWTRVSAISVAPLTFVFSHPSTCTFASAWVEVCVENSYVVAVFVCYFVSIYFRVIYRDISVFSKVETIEFCCQTEYASFYAFEFEIRFCHFVVNIEFSSLEFFSIVAPVPRHEFEISTLCFSKFLHFAYFGLSSWAVSLDEGVEEVCYVLSFFSHTVAESIFSVCFATKEVSDSEASVDDFFDVFNVREFAIKTLSAECTPDFFAKSAIVGISEKWRIASSFEVEQPTFLTSSFSVGSSHFHEISRHTSEFSFVSYETAISVSSFQRVLFEAHRSKAEFFRELFVSLFVFSREVCAIVSKAFECVFEQHSFFDVKAESFANFVYSFNAFEELFVEVDFVRVSFDERHNLHHDLSHFVVRFSAIESEEYRSNVVEEST